MKLPGLVTCALLAAALAVGRTNACCAAPGAPSGAATNEPNIIIILGDNIGYGEIKCYGGSRGVDTPRLDRLAGEGLRLTNFNVEPWCAPSRSALLTGRFGIRSGTSQLPNSAIAVASLVPWEVTLPELLDDRGYQTALFGKWHLGDRPGRYPTDQGFDEFWGIAKSWDEERSNSTPGSDASSKPVILSGTRGGKLERGEVLNEQTGQLMDRTIADKSIEFIQRNGRAKKPFFLVASVSAIHIPVLCDPNFKGKSGAGAIGDALMALDFHVGRVLDALAAAGLADNTIVIFTSDNGPEYVPPYEGNAGPWSGSYSTALEGGLRVPCMIRWPGHVPAGRVSDEIVHITDLFTTLAGVAGAQIPRDRIIDGVDQIAFMTGKQPHSNRDRFPVYVFGRLTAVKMKDWKLHVAYNPNPRGNRFKQKYPEQKLFNLRTDPREEHDVLSKEPAVRTEIMQWVDEFKKTLVAEPPIPPNAPDNYVPARN